MLTVGIPVYNEGKYLRETLNSICSQSFTDFEVYICDDCSTDDTLEIANEFALRDFRFKVLQSDRKLTFVENWERSLNLCSAPYFCWIGGHDLLEKDYFLEAIGLLTEYQELALVFPQSVKIDADDVLGDSADSDIDTSDVEQKFAIIKVADNLIYCTAIHGIFRTEILKKIPKLRIYGFDFLILFLTTLFGKLRKTKKIRFYRREVRQENAEDSITRWKSSGMFKDSKFSYQSILIKNCILYFLKLSSFNYLRRLKVSSDLMTVLGSKFSVSKKEILRAIFNV